MVWNIEAGKSGRGATKLNRLRKMGEDFDAADRCFKRGLLRTSVEDGRPEIACSLMEDLANTCQTRQTWASPEQSQRRKDGELDGTEGQYTHTN